MPDNFHTPPPRWTSLWLGLAMLIMGVLPAAEAAQSVSLAWDPNAEPDLAGYRLKYGTSSGNYDQAVEVIGATTATVTNLAPGTTYFFVVTAYNTALLESLPSNEVSLTTATGNQAPTVSLTIPGNGGTWTAPANLTLNASASDGDGSISRVEFYNGATKLGEATSDPYRFTWSAVPAGSYNLTARAIDNQGQSTESSPVHVTISSNQAPLVTLTSPVSGTNSPAPASLTLAADASDADGSISRVEFYNGTTKLGEDTSSPYGFIWSAVPAGSYNLTARAIDNAGQSTESSPVNVTISTPPDEAPPRIGDVSYLPNGTFQFTFIGQQTGVNSIYASGDMVNWELLSTVGNPNGSAVISDPSAAALNQRFYKIANSVGVSDPVGFVKLEVKGSLTAPGSAYSVPAFSYIGTVMLNAVGYRGTVTALMPNAIADSTAVWTDGQFNGTNGEFYLEITSGPMAGLMTDIVATNAVTKTLTIDDNLVSLLTGGEQYLIRKHRTLAEMFGANNEAGLVGGATVSSADEVMLFNPLTQSYLTFYFKTGGFRGETGWRSTTNAVLDASRTKLYPDQGVQIQRKAGNGTTILAVGAVKAGPTIVPIGSQWNLVANMYPAGQLTLGGSGLRQSDDLSGVAGGSTSKTADEVQITTGASTKIYYYKTGGFGGIGWRSTLDAISDASATAIPVGAAIFVIRKNDRPAFNWTVPQPY